MQILLIEMKHLQGKENNEDDCIDDDELAELYGYKQYDNGEADEDVDYQVEKNTINDNNPLNIRRNEKEHCHFIQPCPSQILTVFLDKENKSDN